MLDARCAYYQCVDEEYDRVPALADALADLVVQLLDSHCDRQDAHGHDVEAEAAQDAHEIHEEFVVAPPYAGS